MIYVFVVVASNTVCEVFTSRKAAESFKERNEKFYVDPLVIHKRELMEA